jgi:beta-N-acetylhexosaminidase
VLASWSPSRLAEQTVVVPVPQSAVATITPEIAAGAGGVILFGSSAPPGLTPALAALKAAAPDGIAPFVMSDEEGGAVQRMPNIVGTVPSARQMGATMTPAQITALAAGVGQKLRGVGVTMDLAPVLDLDAGAGPNNQDAIGTRSFSTDPAVAGADGLAFAQGLAQGGVVAVVKHFPGLGGSSPNTDVAPAATLPWSTLQAGGLRPYEQAVRAGVPAVMISNASVPGLTALPASLSPSVITTVLRGQLGFGGLVLTDSLSAGAISAAGYSVPSATVAALRAGADMVLFNASSSSVASVTAQTVDAVVAAVAAGTLSRARLQDAVGHILAAKGVNLCR